MLLLFKSKKKSIKIELQPFQVKKLKKIKGNLLIVKVGDENHLPSREEVNAIAEVIEKHKPKNIEQFYIVPYWIDFEIK